ncbi:DUF4377 domain-containing protein [Aeromonas bivalvium]|uniref:DUF4377 domain-containing protein n=1 Tax=Aeromonas bivalvium TaxID=440079 RepID=A0ABW9GKP4_9GAMM
MKLPLAAAALALAGCQPAPAPKGDTLFINTQLVPCTGVGPMQCMEVKESKDQDWTLFYSQIQGFTFEPGYLYELKIAKHPVENPPADAPSIRYELLELVSKQAAK